MASPEAPSAAQSLAAPVITSVENMNSSYIRVNFGRVDGADDYGLFRKTKGETSWKRLATTAMLSSGGYGWFNDIDVADGTYYYYLVRAYDTWTGTQSPNSNVVFTRARPGAPYLESAVSGRSGQIQLTFEGDGQSNFRIVRYECGSGKPWQGVALVSGSKTSYTDRKTTVGKTYIYRVHSYVNAGGTNVFSTYSNPRTVKAVAK